MVTVLEIATLWIIGMLLMPVLTIVLTVIGLVLVLFAYLGDC